MKIRSPVVADSFVGALTGNASTATKLASGGAARLDPVNATGASQAIAHGLAAAPSVYFPVPIGGHNGSGGSGDKFPAFTEVTADATHVHVTATEGSLFLVYVAL